MQNKHLILPRLCTLHEFSLFLDIRLKYIILVKQLDLVHKYNLIIILYMNNLQIIKLSI